MACSAAATKPAPRVPWFALCLIASLLAGNQAAAARTNLPVVKPVVVRVGPDHALKTPSEAAAIVGDGTIVEIEDGLYLGDVAVWSQNGPS